MPPSLTFAVEGAEAASHAAAPLLYLKLRITTADPTDAIQTIALQCQIRIDAPRRAYDATEEAGLVDLFGERSRWTTSMHSLLWTHTSLIVPAFTGSTLIDLPVPCSYDFNVATTKYFHALQDGEVPLTILPSGTVFYAPAGGPLQVAPIPWSLEARYRLPVQVWQRMMDHYYPNSAWLQVRQDVADRLLVYRSRLGLPTWEHTLESLLEAAEGART
jgi:hypothetical protein